MRFKVTTLHGESQSLFVIVDTTEPEPFQPAVIGTFTNRELADLATRALNNGATTYFVGIEINPGDCYFHIKRSDGTRRQSITSREYGLHLLERLKQRHPEMIVDSWLILPRVAMHQTYTAKDHYERRER